MPDPKLAEEITYTLFRLLNRIQLARRTPYNLGDGYKLTMLEAETCLLISHRPGITGSEIAKRLNVTRSATSQSLKRLIEKTLVRWEVGEKNAKQKRLFLTPAGESASNIAREQSVSMNEMLFDASETELRHYLRFVEKLEAFHSQAVKSLRA